MLRGGQHVGLQQTKDSDRPPDGLAGGRSAGTGDFLNCPIDRSVLLI